MKIFGCRFYTASQQSDIKDIINTLESDEIYLNQELIQLQNDYCAMQCLVKFGKVSRKEIDRALDVFLHKVDRIMEVSENLYGMSHSFQQDKEAVKLG